MPSPYYQPAAVAAQFGPAIEWQLLEYLNTSLESGTALSEAVISALVFATGPRSLELDIKTRDEDAWPLLHLVVLNEATPAPALGNIISTLLQLGAAPEREDCDGDHALATLLTLAHEHMRDGETVGQDTVVAQLGAMLALLGSRRLKVTQKDVEDACRWLRYFTPVEGRMRQQAFDALSDRFGKNDVAKIWCSEELLLYLDTEAYDTNRPVDAKKVLNFLEQGASPRHGQNGATALLMVILNPYTSYEELLPIFQAMLERDPGCSTIKDGFKLLPLQWAADYRDVSSQCNLERPNPASLLALLPAIVEKLPVDIDAGEVCFNVVPKHARRPALKHIKQQQQLRFKEGDRVLCRILTPGSSYEWEEGTVVDLWYREECWPEDHPGAPYEVLLDLETRVFALVDHDRIICDIKGGRGAPLPSKSSGAGGARFQKRQRDDGSWELLDTKSGRARPIEPPSDSDD